MQKEKLPEKIDSYLYIGDLVRLRYIAQHLVPAKTKSRLLDAGSGKNIYRSLIEKKGYDWHGVDIDPVSPAVYGNLTDIPYPDNHFRMVLCIDVLEHIPAELEALKELHRVLMKDGSLLMHTPNILQTHILADFADNPDHVRKGYLKAELNHLLKQADFSDIQILPTFNILCCLAWEMLNLPSVGRDVIQKLLDFDPDTYQNLGWLVEAKV